MDVHYINLDSNILKKSFHLAIGNFDGVHLGHQKIIKDLVSNAIQEKKSSAILSFDPHPRQFFSRDLDRYQIIGMKKKEEILSSLGLEDLFFLKFNESIANLSPNDFITKIIIDQLQVRKLIVGYDFRFGKNREGDVDLLKDYSNIHGFDLQIIDPITDNLKNEVFSSSAIRDAIKIGNMAKAKMMLGTPWTMEGIVIHGDKRARKMNFPTANILPHDQIYPMYGVYSVKIIINQNKYNGIVNFGERPTVNGKKLLLEAHLFDFDEDIYGKHLTVEFLTFIRGEKKFDNFSLLVEQIKKDIQIAKHYHLKN
jgi:riboflavin kinase / FMN adenylyltransferase